MEKNDDISFEGLLKVIEDIKKPYEKPKVIISKEDYHKHAKEYDRDAARKGYTICLVGDMP